MTTLKELAATTLIEFLPAPDGGKQLVRITSNGKRALDWAKQVK